MNLASLIAITAAINSSLGSDMGLSGDTLVLDMTREVNCTIGLGAGICKHMQLLHRKL